MVPYKPLHAQPSVSPWTGSAMNASIVLDQPGNVSFTNLDTISGKVVLRCGKSASVDSIVVKLEGESRTRLLAPAGPNGERPKPQLEYHKIMYRVQMVFPRADVLEGRANMVGKSTFTLPPGTHEYPFSFKIPFNNACASEKGQMPTIGISGSGLEVAKPATRHVKKTLPPTLSGFPGEAEIRYFVKATVARHTFFKENPRAYAPFNFFPIEPPRAPPSGSEVFARQKHYFSQFPEGDSAKSKMKGLFGKSKEPSSPTTKSDAPYVSVDARLPEPAILTCNDDIPLRIIIKKLNECNEIIHLQSLQISLVSNTKIRAHDVFRVENNSWIVMSKSNMGIPIGTTTDSVGTETVLDDPMWRGQPLPNTVAPTFIACNIERSYQLDVRVGLSYGGGGAQSSSKPQTVVLPLRLDTQVYSGIAPPRELLEAMAEAKANLRRTSTTSTTATNTGAMKDKLKTEGRQESTTSVPSTPIEPSGSSAAPEFPARPGAMLTQEPPSYSDAPPSYEDAIASNLPPVDAPRPDYAPPPPGEDDILRGDEKKGFGKRRDS